MKLRRKGLFSLLGLALVAGIGSAVAVSMNVPEAVSAVSTESFSASGTYSSSASTITWKSVSGLFQILQETGTSQNAPSSSYTSNPRWYGGNIVTFSCVNDSYLITGISFDCTASSRNGSGSTVGLSVSENKVTASTSLTLTTSTVSPYTANITASTPAKTIYLQPSGQIRVDGISSVTITYQEAATITSVTLGGSMTKVDYASGEAWDTTGLKVTSKDSNNVEKEIAHNDSGLTWSFNPTAPAVGGGKVTILATYASITTDSLTFDYTCAVPVLQEIEVSALPTQTSYTVGDAISYDGIEVVAKYDVGDPVDITNDVTYSPASGTTLATAGTVAVTVSYVSGEQTFTDTFDVTVFNGPIVEHSFTSSVSKGSATLGGKSWMITTDNPNGHFQFNGGSNPYLAIGSSSNPTSSSFRSEIISGYRISRVVVNACRGNDSNDATVAIKIGNTVVGAARDMTTSFADYDFSIATPAAGHLEIRFESTAAQYRFKSFTVYGEVDNGAAAAAKAIEVADVCNKTDLAAAISAYDGLTAEAQTECNAIMLDDYANGDTTHSNAKTYNLLSVAEKIAAIRNASTNAAPARQAIELTDNTTLIVLASAFSVSLALGGFILLRKKEEKSKQ